MTTTEDMSWDDLMEQIRTNNSVLLHRQIVKKIPVRVVNDFEYEFYYNKEEGKLQWIPF